MMKYILAFLTAAAAVTVFAAPQRIAVVNMEKVFREYYKSKIAEGAIKQQAEIYRSHLIKMNDQLRAMEKEFEVLRDKAQNLAVAEEVRSKAAADAESKAIDIKSQRAGLQSYAADRQKKMREFELSRREEIIADIRNVIQKKAEAGRIDLVLDIGGRTTSNLPAVIYSKPEMDITAEVIKQLNAVSGKK